MELITVYESTAPILQPDPDMMNNPEWPEAETLLWQADLSSSHTGDCHLATGWCMDAGLGTSNRDYRPYDMHMAFGFLCLVLILAFCGFRGFIQPYTSQELEEIMQYTNHTNLTMHLFYITQCMIQDRNVYNFCSEWGIVGYGTGALSD